MRFSDIKDGKIDAQSNVRTLVITFENEEKETVVAIEVSKEDLQAMGRLIKAYFPER